MSLSLLRLPEDRFLTSGQAENADESSLAAAFAASDAAGLLRLAALPGLADAGLDWLQRFARRWLSRICQTRLTAPPAPIGEMLDWALAAPPFPGSEYLRPESLTRLWEEAGALLTGTCAARADGLEGWLHEYQPQWHLVGRVTFHLAENKRDPDKPFAFLATYADSLNTAGKLQHIPLGRALRSYAESKDQRTLDTILEPVRAAAEASAWAREMLESRQVFQPLAWQPVDAYQFIREIPVLEKAGLVLKVPDWWQGGRPSRPTVQVKLDTDKSMLGIGAMLHFSISTTLDGEPLSAEDWDRIRNSSSGLLNLRGQWVEIDRGKLDEVMAHWSKVADAHAGGGLTFHEGMRFLAGFQGGAGSAAGETGLPGDTVSWSEVIAGKNLQSALDELRDPAARSAPPRVKATLRPYQEKGYGWLLFMRRLGFGACLADDMGLGKTLQVIALLSSAAPEKSAAPALLVVPASLIGNWRAEFARFAPHLRIVYAHASQTPRQALDPILADPASAPELEKCDAVVTTYGLLARSPALQSMAWQAVILDEAQAIRNAGTGQAKAVKKTRAPWRLALTGTPIENRPGDLWSLFDFLNPGLLGGATAFANSLKHLAGTGYGPLRKLVQPYILRRMKTDKSIIPDLPDKTEITAACGLSRKQAILYGKLVEQLKRDLHDDTLSPMERRGVVVSYLVKFKQVCNHPSHWSGDGVYAPADSGKFQRLAEICQEIAERQERVLIFTQFREVIDPLHSFLTGIFRRPGLILHGGTAVGQRQKLVEQFQAPGGPPFFILSVKAGGTGLTLTAASHVIHFDRWWNPAVENQATDRAFRIGQKRNVLVHKFVTAGTIEERIDAMIEDKKALAADLLGKEAGAEVLLTEMSTESLLKFVALDASATLTTDS
ncbi:MAG: DEAD/DEAH box helicase [Verrucomicrobiota bacterium]